MSIKKNYTEKSIHNQRWKKKYAWCACGKSSNQPFCDGKHKGTNITPIVFENKKEGNFALCGCKKTGNPPYCDGAHSKQ